jgi:hypothetical protein
MVRKNMTPQDIRREGLQALLDRLGPAGTIRFLQQYEPGRGDYTVERHNWLDGLTVDGILDDGRHGRAER